MRILRPNIVIWELKIVDNELDLEENLYFISYKRAKKIWKKYEKELEGCDISLGGVQLWL